MVTSDPLRRSCADRAREERGRSDLRPSGARGQIRFEEDMEPRVIRQGDYLLQLAHAFGFDADAVWNDPQNEGIRRLRAR